MSKNWVLYPKVSGEFLDRFPEYDPLILQLLLNRGIKTQKQIDEFFHPDYSQDLFSPYLLLDMEKAIARMEKACKRKEKIGVYGDYDVDGVTSAVLLTNFLKKALGLSGQVYIPDRITEGYGLNKKALKWLIEKGVTLIISCDCGVSNKKEIDYAKSQGVDVIVLDHHHLPHEFSSDYIIIDPKRKNDPYPYKELAACGIVFKFISAFLRAKRSFIKPDIIPENFEKWLLDLVALGTIADCCPLTSENRTLTKYGLLVLSKTKRLGLKKLIAKAGINQKDLNTYQVGFMLAPRINAAGRMNHANTSYRLLMSEDWGEAEELASVLDQANRERQIIMDKIAAEVTSQIDDQVLSQKVIFAQKEGWPLGVVGVVAGKIAEKFCRPTFILSKGINQSVGSARSIPSFNLISAINKCKDLLLEFGGHRQAAGVSVENRNIDLFKKRILEIAEKELSAQDLVPQIKIDAEINLNQIDWQLFEKLKSFEPYGPENQKPIFLRRKVQILDVFTVGAESKHLKMKVRDPKPLQENSISQIFEVIGFDFGNQAEAIKKHKTLDIVFEIDSDEWNGNKKLQLKLVDWKG